MDVKASTKEAKQAAFMTLVHHNMVYMIFMKILSAQDSMISKHFATKLASAKTDDQLDLLLQQLMEQFPSPTKNNLKIPTLEEMELEVMHLVSYWNDNRVSTTLFRLVQDYMMIIVI